MLIPKAEVQKTCLWGKLQIAKQKFPAMINLLSNGLWNVCERIKQNCPSAELLMWVGLCKDLVTT